MRKAKVAAIVCGVIASCLFGGFAVVDAATITLDDSSTAEVAVYNEPASVVVEIAATVTSIESTATAATSTIAKTDSDLTEAETEIAPAETTAVADNDIAEATTAIKSIAISDEFIKFPPVKETAPATEAPVVRTTVQTTATTKAEAKATTKVTTKEVTVPSTKAPQTEVVYTNPPMPAQTTTVTTTAAPAPQTEPATEAPTEPATEAPVVVTPSVTEVSESDYILLCNAVAHEAGSNNISETEKAKVVEVIMNRVASPSFPNTIYGVLTQKYQFSGSSTYVNLGTYSSKVTDKVKAGVDLYFADPSAFNHGYLYFTGNGSQNNFR